MEEAGNRRQFCQQCGCPSRVATTGGVSVVFQGDYESNESEHDVVREGERPQRRGIDDLTCASRVGLE